VELLAHLLHPDRFDAPRGMGWRPVLGEPLPA
jgi:hypothetical protein